MVKQTVPHVMNKQICDTNAYRKQISMFRELPYSKTMCMDFGN